MLFCNMDMSNMDTTSTVTTVTRIVSHSTLFSYSGLY